MDEPVVFEVNNKRELKELLLNHKISFFPRYGKVNFHLDHMPEDERIVWEEKLSKYYFECGCDMGAKFSVLFIILYLLFIIFFTDLKTILNLQTILYGFAAVITGAAFGKITGLLYYKFMLHRSVKKLLNIKEPIN